MSKELSRESYLNTFEEAPCEEFDIFERTDTFAKEISTSGLVTEAILAFRNGKGYSESEFSLAAISYEDMKVGIPVNGSVFTVDGYGFILSGKKNFQEESTLLSAVSFIVMEDWQNSNGVYKITPCIVQLQGMTFGGNKKDVSVKSSIDLLSSFQWTDALTYFVEEFAKANNYEGVGIMPAISNLSVGRVKNFTLERAIKIYDETAQRRDMHPTNGIFYKQF